VCEAHKALRFIPSLVPSGGLPPISEALPHGAGVAVFSWRWVAPEGRGISATGCACPARGLTLRSRTPPEGDSGEACGVASDHQLKRRRGRAKGVGGGSRHPCQRVGFPFGRNRGRVGTSRHRPKKAKPRLKTLAREVRRDKWRSCRFWGCAAHHARYGGANRVKPAHLTIIWARTRFDSALRLLESS